jgi:hypothetical protein
MCAKMQDLFGLFVRQASLRELAQRILAREKFKFSPKRFAKQATIEIDSYK